jgi:hypothetical protein
MHIHKRHMHRVELRQRIHEGFASDRCDHIDTTLHSHTSGEMQIQRHHSCLSDLSRHLASLAVKVLRYPTKRRIRTPGYAPD